MKMLVKLTRIGQLSGGGHSVSYENEGRPELVNLRFARRIEYWSGTGLAVWMDPNFCPIYHETMEQLEKLMSEDEHENARADSKDAGTAADQ